MAVKGFMVEAFVTPIAVGVSIALLLGVFSLYNDVQANTSARVNSESKDKMLSDMKETLLIMGQDLKYLRNEVDELKDGQKTLTTQLQEDRNRVLRPWEYQSKKE